MMLEVMTYLAYLMSHGQSAHAMVHHFSIKSSAFKQMRYIPKQYTCFGRNESLPLHWQSVPPSTKSLALIMQDRDAPSGPWYHWGLYDISPQEHRFNANMHTLPYGVHMAKNSWQHAGYEGPCPSSGQHRYRVTLYALDKRFSDHVGLTTKGLTHLIKGHVIAMTQLTGLVQADPNILRHRV